MARNKRDPLPESFASLDQAADFWDRHDLSDYLDLTSPVAAEVRLERRTYLAALEPELAKQVSRYAQGQGVSSETLINLWLSEKLAAVSRKG